MLTSFSLRWFIIRLFYKAEPATELLTARGRTEMDIKRAAMANMILPSRYSDNSRMQFTEVQTDPFKPDKDKTPSSGGFFSHASVLSRELPAGTEPIATPPMVPGMRCLICSHNGEWWNLGLGSDFFFFFFFFLPGNVRHYQHFPNLKHSNEANTQKIYAGQEISDIDLRSRVQCNSDIDIPLDLGILHPVQH